MLRFLMACVLALTPMLSNAETGANAPRIGPLSALTQQQIAQVKAAVAPYRDHARVRADGWRKSTGHVPLMGEHWSRRDKLPDYTSADRIDFTRPTNLMYAEIGGRRELVAVAYVVRIGAAQRVPQGFAGAADRWHVHNTDEILAAQEQVRPFLARVGRNWVERSMAPDGLRRLAMVHVWLGDNPYGAFENFDPTLPYRRLRLGPATYSTDFDAARGIALAHPQGCDNELNGDLFLGAVPGSVRRDLKRSCRSIARQVRLRLNQPPARLNAFAAAAWTTLDGMREAKLTPAQKARIGAMVEGDLCLPSMQ